MVRSTGSGSGPEVFGGGIPNRPVPTRYAVTSQRLLLVAIFCAAAACSDDVVDPVNQGVGGGTGSSQLDREVLVALYSATGGPDWRRNDNWHTDAPLKDWWGVEVDSVGRVTSLRLDYHGLAGRIPSSLGQLAKLKTLDLGGNALVGTIPPQLGQLTNLDTLVLFESYLTGSIPPQLGQLSSLKTLELGGSALGGSALVGVIPPQLGQLAQLERLVIAVSEVSGSIPPQLGELVSLKALWLSDNKLTGPVPPELGKLTGLRSLSLAENELTGILPKQLTQLRVLDTLRFGGSGLCAPATADFHAWLKSISSEGPYCNREDQVILRQLHSRAGGGAWTRADGWLEGPFLTEWHGVTAIDSLGRVVALDLSGNGLTGRLPKELGDLASLKVLKLADNALTWRLPTTLARLPLDSLHYVGTDLCAPGGADFQAWLNGILSHEGTGATCAPLEDRDFLIEFYDATSGPHWNYNTHWVTDAPLNMWVGVQVDDAGRVVSLVLPGNGLFGRLPPELGKLASLELLHLNHNTLAGSIPPELGQLGSLRGLHLIHNDLTGPLPPDLGNLTDLAELAVQGNMGLEGALPDSLTELTQLTYLDASGTNLCAPGDADFQAWLGGVSRHRVRRCETPQAVAYLVQAVQSWHYPVPIIAGRDALLRVFVTASVENNGPFPPVRATFYSGESAVHVEEIDGRMAPIPTKVSEGLNGVTELSGSANAHIPGSVLRPGVEMVVELDPEGTLDPALKVAKRIPETGRLPLEVQTVPTLNLTLVPFLRNENPDSSVLGPVEAMAEDPTGHELLADIRALLPVGELKVTAHEPVWTSINRGERLLTATRAIWVIEGKKGHYMGTSGNIPFTNIFVAGMAEIGGRISYLGLDAAVMAHELGHNMNLLHAPCGVSSFVDTWYPYRWGMSGVPGYDFSSGELVDPRRADLMSYCSPVWVSDYHFRKALTHRLRDEVEGEDTRRDLLGARKTLLIWGGIDANGIPYLEPTFVVHAQSTLPDSAGDYELSGHSEDGRDLFTLRFEMQQLADAGDAASFAFALPVRPDWAENLASITLSGPGGTAKLDRETDRPMTILRDSQSGRVRGLFHGWLTQFSAQIGPGAKSHILMSRGIPNANAWNPGS